MSAVPDIGSQVSAPSTAQYRFIHSATLEGRVVQWWDSPALRDDPWDDFLESIPLGHFQQSSRWAEAKSVEGWRPIRRILTLGDHICAGFQILFRQTRFGRIGYISKGPVVDRETPAIVNLLLDTVKSTVQASKLCALILQLPDKSIIEGSALAAHRFLPNHLVNVLRATLLVDLALGMDAIGRHIRSSTWKQIRKAQRRGIIIREATDQDLPSFFRLMLATCQRQRARPSPATSDALLALWKAFQPHKIRLTLAQFENEPVAGCLCLCFGERVTFWKRGWSGLHRDRHPNELLQHEAVGWSCNKGYNFFDFATLRPDIAKSLLNGEKLSEDQRKTRDFINLGHGNHPVLLPEARIYIPNPFLRSAYQICMSIPPARNLAAKLLHI